MAISETLSVSLLPAQLARLTALSGVGNRDGVRILEQHGTHLYVELGEERFWMNGNGNKARGPRTTPNLMEAMQTPPKRRTRRRTPRAKDAAGK